MRTVYRSIAKQVDFIPALHNPTGTLGFTFGSLGIYGRDGAGIGGDFLLSLGVDVLALKTTRGDWYQDMPPDLLRQIAEDAGVRSYKRRIGYGSSMGGYAAAAFAPYLDMTDVLAFSPQFDIHPEHEPRWTEQLQFFDWTHDMQDNPACRYVVVYDPENRDIGHIRRYREVLTNLREIALPGAGHSSITHLHQKELLKPFVRAFFLEGKVKRLTPLIPDWLHPAAYINFKGKKRGARMRDG